MADPPPAHFVPRPAEFDALVARLLASGARNVAITAALRGAGGYGKTTLAKALCHDARIQAAFPDRTLWTKLSQTPGSLVTRVEDLIKHLSGANSGFNNAESVFLHFKELLAERRMLLVIDDVWDRDHLRPFLQGGPNVARLITTRNLDTIASCVERENQVKVDAMRLAEAARMLRAGLPAGCDEQIEALADRLGCWPFLLGLANGALRERTDVGESLAEALAFVHDDLEENGLTAFDAASETERDRAVRTMLGVSFKMLSDVDLERFHELAIFPEDALVPLATVEWLWRQSGGLSRVAADKLYNRLYNLSLLLNLDRQARALQLHDVMWKYLNGERKGRLAAIHNQLLDAHRPAQGWAELPDDEPYLWDHLAEHLAEAGRGEELVATVKDWRYLAKKTLLRKSRSVERDLLRAEATAPDDDPLRTLRRSVANTGHLFNRCKNRKEVEDTIYARLQHLPELAEILQDVAQKLSRPHVLPFLELPDLPHPALIRSIEEHSASVWNCAFSPDGRFILSASEDKSLKLWRADSGEFIRSLEEHSATVFGCAFSPDGEFILSASADNSLKLWRADSGQLIRSLEGHSGWVLSCVFSPDGEFILSASADNSLKLWHADSGELIRSLEGHSDSVSSCAFSPDGKFILSASDDNSLKLWHADSGECLATFYVDGWLSCCAVWGDRITAGGAQGVYFLRLVQ